MNSVALILFLVYMNSRGNSTVAKATMIGKMKTQNKHLSFNSLFLIVCRLLPIHLTVIYQFKQIGHYKMAPDHFYTEVALNLSLVIDYFENLIKSEALSLEK